jgi:hypothetical protein
MHVEGFAHAGSSAKENVQSMVLAGVDEMNGCHTHQGYLHIEGRR